MSGGEWYVLEDGADPVGPYSTDQLRRDVAAGNVSRTAKVTQAGAAEWQSVLSIPELVPRKTEAPAATTASPAPRADSTTNFNKAAAISMGIGVAVAFATWVAAAILRDLFKGFFSTIADLKETTAYIAFPSAAISWRLAAVCTVGVLVKSLSSRSAAGRLRGWLFATTVTCIALAHWPEYQVVCVCGLAVVFSEGAGALLLGAPATLIVAGWITGGFTYVPFTTTPVESPQLHLIALVMAALWMFVMAIAGIVASEAAKRLAFQDSEGSVAP